MKLYLPFIPHIIEIENKFYLRVYVIKFFSDSGWYYLSGVSDSWTYGGGYEELWVANKGYAICCNTLEEIEQRVAEEKEDFKHKQRRFKEITRKKPVSVTKNVW